MNDQVKCKCRLRINKFVILESSFLSWRKIQVCKHQRWNKDQGIRMFIPMIEPVLISWDFNIMQTIFRKIDRHCRILILIHETTAFVVSRETSKKEEEDRLKIHTWKIWILIITQIVSTKKVILFKEANRQEVAEIRSN
jgi:hypothetical protein